ncbi:MAG: DNA repair protein RecN [Muribaculaceae bacterium]|nr:DNA repair protein RecN [Muribaculaceae bacterium]
MLERLSITNYALIERLDINFRNGLSIITGETGAGKSVMMGALSLLMGERVDSKILANRETKATIEAQFDRVAPEVQALFSHYDLDWNGGQVIVRREISVSGRSRAFVNDTPVTLPVLADVAQHLVDVHSQNSNRLLSLPAHQLWIIDAMAGDAELLETYKRDFRQYVELRSRIRKAREAMGRTRENREFITFQLEQLDKINPKRGELAEIERQFDILSDADDLRERIYGAYSALDGGEGGALGGVSTARELLDGVNMSLFGEDSDEGPDIMTRLESLYIETKDLAQTLETVASGIEADPLLLAKVSSRMNELYEAQKRFKVSGDDALVDLRESLREQLEGIAGGDVDLAGIERDAKIVARRLKAEAEQLSETRERTAREFAERLTEEARPLGLKNLHFEVRNTRGKLTSDGQDTIEFWCAFNKNQEPLPLVRVASGGEMSRLTLCIKGMIAGMMKLPTVIFDEIDTGVSGEIADRMGSMMADIAADMQVIAITHLPQVAARGKNHYKVFKTDLADKTVTRVTALDEKERVEEIARMLSGSEVNKAALDNARALLRAAKKQ